MYHLLPNPNRVMYIPTNSVLAPGTWRWDEYEAWLAEGNTPLPIPEGWCEQPSLPC